MFTDFEKCCSKDPNDVPELKDLLEETVWALEAVGDTQKNILAMKGIWKREMKIRLEEMKENNQG